MNVAVIPARGGSKRLPGKNIRMFAGKPIIAWSIAAARASRLFDHIIVSTDSPEIADVSQRFGAEVPFVRPADISDDYAGTTAVVRHATQWMVEHGWDPSVVCCIYATAPLLRVEDLAGGLETLLSGRWAYAFSAAEFAAPVSRSFRQLSGGGVEMLFPDQFETRSQDATPILYDAAQFYWGLLDSWIEGKRIFDRHSTTVVLPRSRVQDIDTEEDWQMAELMFRRLALDSVGRGADVLADD